MRGRSIITRILPGLTSEYAIVGLPQWAWLWIDDHVEELYANDYRQFIDDTKGVLEDEAELTDFLSLMASDLRDYQLRDMHNLANDNDVLNSNCPFRYAQNITPVSPPAFKFPTIFMVFKFIPHATDLKTLWLRKNYSKYVDNE